MTSRIASYGLSWEIVAAESVDASQQWVLSAMGRHGAGLVNMLWRILGSEEDVCDAYQETFLQLAHYEGQQKPENVKAYLFRTATNVAISMLRREQVREKFVRSMTAEMSSARQNSEQELDAKYLQETLRMHITKLPEHLRNVITLHDLGELSYEQVGKILQMPPGTARVYRHKAVQLLAVWMSEKKNDK